MLTVAISTLGCKVNQYESACILEPFLAAGWKQVPFNGYADVYIVNSCTVTNRADFKSRNAVRRALKNPDAKVVLTGCYVMRHPEVFRDENVLVVDNATKHRIFELLGQLDVPMHLLDGSEEYVETFTTQMSERTRAFVKIQDGCSFRCAYCAVPDARGKPRSRDPENVKKQIIALTENGFREFVLGGINMGLYGIDNGYSFVRLLRELDEIPQVERIRLSSIEPQLFTNELLDAFGSMKMLAPHFHIPLQSGSDDVLKRMGRHYDTAEFRMLIERLQQIFEQPALGFDVIAGFPGETDGHHQETIAFLESLPLTYLHVFGYSKRSGTPASTMKNQVHGDTIKQRCSELEALSARKKEEYIEQLITNQRQLSAIAEKSDSGWAEGMSDRFVRVYQKQDVSEFVNEGKIFSGVSKKKHFDGIELHRVNRFGGFE